MLKLTYTENSFYLEVTLEGSWLSEGNDDSVGVFVTTMSYSAEFFCINFGKNGKMMFSHPLFYRLIDLFFQFHF